MIFASQDPESQAFVVFLTVIVAIINVGMLVGLVVQMVREYVHEQKEAAAENDGAGSSFSEIISNARDSVHRWRFNRMTPDAQQRAIRRRTFDAADGNTAENPVTIEMTGIYNTGESTGEIKVDDAVIDVGGGASLMRSPSPTSSPTLAALPRRNRLTSMDAKKKGLTYKNPTEKRNNQSTL
jgi:hypothetical protein